MEIGIDSFAANTDQSGGSATNNVQVIEELLARIVHADACGLDVFGIGEHHRKEFLDSAPIVLLAAAAARTQRIRLTSAVTVLSAADPVRVFQNFATLDLVSRGRAEMVVGRGSFIEAYPLFGLDLNDYDELFAEKLELLLTLREREEVTWSGKFRPALKKQSVYPRPLQNPLPIWLGVGGTPASFIRAGVLGMPLMVAVIGGETHRFRPLIDLYQREQYEQTMNASRLIDFQYKGTSLQISFADGSSYEYFGLPKSVYSNLVNSITPDRFARRHIYHSYVYRQVNKAMAVEATV